MYESEKERLKKFLSVSEEKKLDLLQQANTQLHWACGIIFKRKSPVLSVEILRATSIWAMKCDGLCNEREISFLSNYLRKTSITAQNWISSYSVSEAKNTLEAFFLTAQYNVCSSNSMHDEYMALLDAISVIFGFFATSDGIISDDTGEALNALTKMIQM